MNDSNQRLIAQLNSQGIPVSPQCKSGVCGACAVRVGQATKIVYRFDPIAFIPTGHVLLCCVDLEQSQFEVKEICHGNF